MLYGCQLLRRGILVDGPRLTETPRRGQLLDGQRGKQLCGGDANSGSVSSGDDLNRQDGITTEIKEIVASSDTRDAQRLAPDGCQRCLGLIGRRYKS